MIFRCLEKNPDNRPFLVELLEHPFFTELIGPTGSDHHVRRYLSNVTTGEAFIYRFLLI